MPKNAHNNFFNPKDSPYLSVLTPSTHDMSIIRSWWEEDKSKTQKFYNQLLGESGEPPLECEPWINRAIVMQHLYSPAMWSIFQLQDLLGINEKLRRKNPHEERINVPANPDHYWKYRMHITLDDLIKEKEFTLQLKELVQNSGRNI
jgi:4-alpha-glucanotransferase